MIFNRIKLINRIRNISRATRKSLAISISVIGFASVIMSIVGFSLVEISCLTVWLRLGVVLIAFMIVYAVVRLFIGEMYKNSITFNIQNTEVCIKKGDIFNTPGFKIIGCDSHYDSRIDDVVIRRDSLQGKLFLEHGRCDEIEEIVNLEALRRKIHKNKNGKYNFPIGTIIKYYSSVDNQFYLLLSMTELDKEYKASITLDKYEQMLIEMWKEIDRVYAGHDIVLPLLGSKIVRFNGTCRDEEFVLKCMLCTLRNSGVDLSSKVTIVLFDTRKKIDLFELRNYEK